MSEQGNRRPVLLAVTGIAATIVLLLAYHKFNQPSTVAASSLHRRKAVRRSRRRWRQGAVPRELDRNPVESSLENLGKRIAQSQPYGRYDNRTLFTIDEDTLEGGLFDLLPNNISKIHKILTDVRPMSDVEKDKLKFHISSLFVQNFLQEEFPAGWVIGEDVEILVQELKTHDIDEVCVRDMVSLFDHGKLFVPENLDVREEPASDGLGEYPSTQQAIETLAGPSHADASDDTDSDDDDDESDPGGSQNMLDLLYHIASEQAKREGFIHRTVECNGCGVKPIQGIRYHCVNCYDYDLCEDCEAQQIHNRSHIFYKIRIPAPERSHIRQAMPVLYPGQPNAFPSAMPRELQRQLLNQVGMDKTEMEASYEQFKCLAGEQISVEDDPAHLGMAISRQNFDMFFTPSSADRPPPPNLIYDRIFAFYDFHHDGVITFDEYIIGIFTIQDKTRGVRLKRMFMGFDLDADGYVDRRDFLRMFRANYALTKELHREMISLQDELDDDIRDVVQGSQPISAAFSGHLFHGHTSRAGQDKEIDSHGDLVVSAGSNGVLQNDTEMRGDRTRAIGNAAVQNRTRTHPFRSFRQQPEVDEPLMSSDPPNSRRRDLGIPFAEELQREEQITSDPTLHVYAWPPQQPPEAEDIISAIGADIPIDEVTDPVDRSRVIYAQMERLDEESDKILDAERAAAVREFWRRRQFYLDEEEGLTRPPGYTEPDSSDDSDDAASIDEPPDAAPQTSSSSRRQSMRSRSSSKVRFDDSAIDTDHETRSNTSSRSVPANERWGGFELSAPERDVGREILYQAVQQGFNEVLDPLFKRKEDEAMETIASKTLRTKWAKEIDKFEVALRKKAEDTVEALRQADLLRTQALLSNGVDNTTETDPVKVEGEACTPSTEVDETDHTQVVFDNERTNPQNASQIPRDTSKVSTDAGSEDISDPTLPQNKPNDPSFVYNARSDSLTQRPTDTILRKWLRHRRIEEQAQKCGGYGKLSYREFCRLMIHEANRDEVTDTLGQGPSGGRGIRRDRTATMGINDESENESEEDTDEQAWSSTGAFGRLNFLDTWLETALF